VIGAGVVALGACAVCCAGPVLAILGGLSIASLAGAVWIPALAVVAVIALVGMVWVLRRRRRATCATPTGPVELGMPGEARADRGRAGSVPRA
jgi:mercuric ion transport protein